MRRWGWAAYVGVGAAATAAYYLVDPTVAKLAIWPAIGASSVAAIVIGTRRHRPAHPLAWYLFALGQLTFVIGDTLYVLRARVLNADDVFPSVVDFLYLAMYPCLVIGLLLLIRARSLGRDTASLIDATMIATGLGLLIWVFLIGPYVRSPDLSMLQRAVSIAYPLGDVLLLFVVARLGVGPGGRSPAWWLLAGGVVPLLVADILFGLRQLAGTWEFGGAVDLGWILFYVGWGAAALHPSMASLSEPATVADGPPRGRLLLVTGASLMAPAILAIQGARGKPIDIPVIVAGSTVLFLLALARMSGLARQLALQQERKRVMQMVMRMTEVERARLAADLHDGPVQQLTALLYGLEVARTQVRRGDVGPADSLLAGLEEKAATEIHGLRRLMTHLRPPVLDELGLESALHNQGKSFEGTIGVPCTVYTDLDDELPRELETVLYRVTQESLANIGKHAQASRVAISLATDDGVVCLRVSDDGVGFDPAAASDLVQQGHFGLVSMRERVEMVGGRLLVDSSPGQGTTIAVEMDRHRARR